MGVAEEQGTLVIEAGDGAGVAASADWAGSACSCAKAIGAESVRPRASAANKALRDFMSSAPSRGVLEYVVFATCPHLASHEMNLRRSAVVRVTLS